MGRLRVLNQREFPELIKLIPTKIIYCICTYYRSLTIPFPSTEIATIVYDVISVDKELKGSGVQRTILNEGEKVVINLEGEEPKKLRVAANSMMKNIKLIIKTVELFKID